MTRYEILKALEAEWHTIQECDSLCLAANDELKRLTGSTAIVLENTFDARIVMSAIEAAYKEGHDDATWGVYLND